MPRPDLIIVARGGGSLEDLWAFNDEIVVRAAAAQHDPADLGCRPRDRHHADRLRRRHARADADRGGRNGGAGAGRADDRLRSRIARTSPAGSAASKASPGAARRLARALPALDELLALPRQRLDAFAGRLPRALRANAQCPPYPTDACGLTAVAAAAVAPYRAVPGEDHRIRRPERAVRSAFSVIAASRVCAAHGQLLRRLIPIAACLGAASRGARRGRAARCGRRRRSVPACAWTSNLPTAASAQRQMAKAPGRRPRNPSSRATRGGGSGGEGSLFGA